MSWGNSPRNGIGAAVINTAALRSSFGGERFNPSINLVFAGATTLDPRITFSRASTATRVNSAGLIESVASNAPRFDYDPVTLQPKGLLIEEQRTNLLQQSANLSVSPWANGGTSCTVTANDGISPDGTKTAEKLDSAANSGRYNGSAGTLANATVYTTSIFVKLISGGPNISLVVAGQHVFGGAGGDRTVVFNASTGAFVSKSSDVSSYSITSYGNNWWRVSGTFTTTSSAVTAMAIYAGSSSAIFYAWGGQVEAGTFPTSYIPTTSAAATRAADVAVMTGTNFSSWYNQSEGTLFAEWVAGADTDFINVFSIGSSAANGGTMNMRRGTTGNLAAAVVDGTTTQALLSVVSGAPVAGTTYKGSLAYKANDFAAVSNGGTVQTDTSGTVPNTLATLVLGTGWNNANAAIANEYLNGHIKRLAFWPRRLSNSELQAVTS